MSGKIIAVTLLTMLSLILGSSGCSSIYPTPQQPVTTSTPNQQTTTTPGSASPTPAPITAPAQSEQSGPASLGISYEVVVKKDPSWSLDKTKVVEYGTDELENGVTIVIPAADVRIIPVTSTKDRIISGWGFSEMPRLKDEPENYIDFWVVNEWGGKEFEPVRTFNLHAQAITYAGTYYIYLSNQFDSNSAKEVVLHVKWVTPSYTPPKPPPQPISQSIPQHQLVTIDMLTNFQLPDDIRVFPIYIKSNQRLHFTFSVTQGQAAFWFKTPTGKNIRLNTAGNLVETNLHDGEFIQLGNVIFKPSDYGWGEGDYEMTFGISDIGENLNGENKAQVQVEYRIED
jgi:hypothetical protein